MVEDDDNEEEDVPEYDEKYSEQRSEEPEVVSDAIPDEELAVEQEDDVVPDAYQSFENQPDNQSDDQADAPDADQYDEGEEAPAEESFVPEAEEVEEP